MIIPGKVDLHWMKEEPHHSMYVKLRAYLIRFSQQSRDSSSDSHFADEEMEAPSVSSLLMVAQLRLEPLSACSGAHTLDLGESRRVSSGTRRACVCCCKASCVCVKTNARRRPCRGTCWPRLQRQQEGLPQRDRHCLA